MKKISLMKSKNYVIYARKDLVLMMIIKSIIKSLSPHRKIAAHSICNLRYKTPKEIPVVFHNGSTYDYHFIIKQLAKEFDGQFECLGENTEKYITFSVPIKKELDNSKTITYKLKFIDSFRFMSTSLSKLVHNLSEIYSKKCRYKNRKSEHEFKWLKNSKLSYDCEECKKKKESEPMNGLIEKFSDTCKFINNDTNKFVLLLRKGVYPYERFYETTLPNKKTFYSKLYLEDITDEDYVHAQKLFEEFKLKHLFIVFMERSCNCAKSHNVA